MCVCVCVCVCVYLYVCVLQKTANEMNHGSYTNVGCSYASELAEEMSQLTSFPGSPILPGSPGSPGVLGSPGVYVYMYRCV